MAHNQEAYTPLSSSSTRVAPGSPPRRRTNTLIDEGNQNTAPPPAPSEPLSESSSTSVPALSDSSSTSVPAPNGPDNSVPLSDSSAHVSLLDSSKLTFVKDTKSQKKGQKAKKFLQKKELSGLAVRGAHLHRLVQSTKLSRQQILNLSKKYAEFAPTGYMTLAEFKKALDFEKDKEDPFANRLFAIFSSTGSTEVISMDDFIEGVAKLAPDADIDGKLNLCYDMFDRDGSGTVMLNEFREMTKYSMRHGRFGIDDDKLNHLIESQWRHSGDNEVSREEFKTVLKTKQSFVNSLTLQVPWLQQALKNKDIGSKSARDYLPSEPLSTVIGDVAQQFNAPDADVDNWTEELQRNLYADVKSLRDVTSEDWNSMRLPRRLYRAVMRAIDPNHQTSADILFPVVLPCALA